MAARFWNGVAPRRVFRTWTSAACPSPWPAGVLAACGSGGAGVGSAQCASMTELDGRDYFGHAAELGPHALGEELGQARIPPCDDDNGSQDSAEQVVAVRVEGVPPSVAVGVTYSDEFVFVREGYPVESLPPNTRRLLGQ